MSDDQAAMRSGSDPPRATFAVLIAGSVTIVVVLPLFLLGALAVQMRVDLGLTVAALGLVVAGYRAFTAAIAIRIGRVVDRVGATLALRAAAGLSALSMVGIAIGSFSWVSLSLWLLLASASFAVGQTSVNRYLSIEVPPERRGFAFGLKQSSVPVATLLAGAAVPAIALTVGWRWVFGLAGLLGVLVVLVIPSASSTRMAASGAATSGPPPPSPPRGPIALFALAFGLSMAGASPLGVFLVDHAVQVGYSPGPAGLLLSVGSIASIASRLLVGRAADRVGSGHLRWVAGMVGLGAVAYLLLATGNVLLVAVGTVFSFAFGWGFNGLFWFAVLRAYPDSPAAVTGRVMLGSLFGGLIGPLVFGFVAELASYGAAWVVAALFAAGGAAAMLASDRLVARQAHEARGGDL